MLEIRVSLNGQDFDTVADFTFYARPSLSQLLPTGGPTLPGYTVTLQVLSPSKNKPTRSLTHNIPRRAPHAVPAPQGSGFDAMSEVELPYKPLCGFGPVAVAGEGEGEGKGGGGGRRRTGQVLSMTVVPPEEGSNEPSQTSVVCAVPAPLASAAGASVVSIALNGKDFDEGTPDLEEYVQVYGRPPTPKSYLYYTQARDAKRNSATPQLLNSSTPRPHPQILNPHPSP